MDMAIREGPARTGASDLDQVVPAPWWREPLPDWPAIRAECAQQVGRWPVPPRWKAGDWWAEIAQLFACVAWEAVRDFDAARGVPLRVFVARRVVDHAWSYHRREWCYGRRADPEPPLEISENVPIPGFDTEAVRSVLCRLAERDRWLIKRLYWDRWTQAAVAEELGISQQAVSDRKQRVLQEIRRLYEEIVDAGGRIRPHR